MKRDERPPSTEPRLDDAGAEYGAAEYGAFALEDEKDSQRTRVAIAGAVVIHALLFIAPLGFLKPDTAVAAPPPQKVFVMEVLRFKPPPPDKQPVLPERAQRKVPIPDPTPDDPEPLRLEEEIPQQFDMPDIDLVAGIPEAPPPMEPEGPIPYGGDVTRPVQLSGPKPQYTEIARRARIEGVVIVEAIIDKGGNVTNVRILKPLPMGLDQAAADAVSQWKFEPATLNGKPVDVLYSLSVNFRLQQ